jgi:hypothetical protein
MQWSEVVDNPYFKNLPFKIELNRYGKVEMTPASNKHGRLQSQISALLEQKLKKGEALTECSIQTIDGVKVADVAWCSKAFIKQYVMKRLIRMRLSFALKSSRLPIQKKK